MPGTDALGDLYEILGVRHDADADAIKKAYRAPARELHPDTNPDPTAEARFKEVTLAYEVLKDPERRARYDRFGPEGVFGAQAGAAGGFGFEGGLGDIFEAFFGGMGGGGGNRRRGPAPGADAEVRLGLDFAEAVFGCRKELTVRLPVTCEVCDGRGTAPGTEPETCAECAGAGELRRVRQSLLGQVVTSVACSRCSGTGLSIPHPCDGCAGEGRRIEERTFTVEVPAGVEDGSTLRLAERGAAGQRGGPPGSLFVHLAVTPDRRFERQGDNLHTTLSIGLAQAAIGVETQVQGIDSTLPITVPAGTQHGYIERMRGAGVPHLRGRGRGDLFVHVMVATPTDLTSEQEELLRQYAAARGEEISPPGAAATASSPDCDRRLVSAAYAAIGVRAAAAAQVFVSDIGQLVLSEEDDHHLARVLRLRAGEEVIACDGSGRWRRTAWTAKAGLEPLNGAAGLAGDGGVQQESAAAPALTVAFAPTKGERPEWVTQKLTELGIDRIVPLLSERSVVRWDHDRAKHAVEKLRRVSRGAAAQCRRVWLPEVTDVAVFADLPQLSPNPGQVVLAQLSGDRPDAAHRVVAVGPEGGWSEDELGCGLPTVGFGLSVLRAETAAVTAGALMMSLRTGTVKAVGKSSS